jgi:hypothetical protein
MRAHVLKSEYQHALAPRVRARVAASHRGQHPFAASLLSPAQLLSLQASAGNSAVTDLIQRATPHAKTASRPKKHVKPAHPSGKQAVPAPGHPSCPNPAHPAHTFKELVDLIHLAEAKLTAAGYASVEDRIHILRGIYYGTPWSMDFNVEKSPVRNLAFQIYTASGQPDDPRTILDCGIFDALIRSAEVTDKSRKVDVGHLMIGLDARRSWSARAINIPTQGGTGLEISTWLGDLGGAAGMLSIRRVKDPTIRAVRFFRGSDFGGEVNLEGDIAAYLVAADATVTTKPSAPSFKAGQSIADAVEDYLSPKGAGPKWNARCTSFLAMLGGQFTAKGTLSNKATLTDELSDKIEGFGEWYMVNRLRQTNRLDRATMLGGSKHLHGGSHEVAQVFVDVLEHGATHPGAAASVVGSGPAPSPPGAESAALRAMLDASDSAKSGQQGLKKLLHNFGL